jgi:hypothetical protein
MCEQCEKLEAKLRRYRRLVTLALDPLTIERINALIAELELAKKALH